MCPQIKGPLLCSIFLPELVTEDTGICQDMPFCAGAGIRGGLRYGVLPLCTGTSEPTWSEHWYGQV